MAEEFSKAPDPGHAWRSPRRPPMPLLLSGGGWIGLVPRAAEPRPSDNPIPASRPHGGVSSVWWLKRISVVLLLFALVAIPATKSAAQSDEVLQAQTELQARGYDPGPLDGFMGRRTQQALRRFQEDTGKPVTGVLDEATLETLAAPEPEPQAETTPPHTPLVTPSPATEQLAATPSPAIVQPNEVVPVQQQMSQQSETNSEPKTSVKPSPELAPIEISEPNDTRQYAILVALITLAIAGLLALVGVKRGAFSSLRRLIRKPSADDERDVGGMAVIIGFFHALLQLRERRFLQVLIRSVAFSAPILAGVAAAAAWLVYLLPDTVALPLIGKVTMPIIGEIAVPLIGEVAVPLRQADVITIPLMIVISSFLMFPTAAAVVNLTLDDIVDAVEARHFPHLPELRPSRRVEMIVGAVAFSLIVVAINLGALVFYLIAGALAPLIFWVVNGFIIGREYFALVAGRRLPPAEVAALQRIHGWRIWFAGCLMAVPLSLPLIGLIIPALGTATFTHMFHRFLRAVPSDRPQDEEEPERSDAAMAA